MTKVICDTTMSVDGYVPGPDQTLEQPLGRGGDQLHEWMVATKAFRETHGMDGGEDNADSRRLEEQIGSIGATIMGRRMFSGGSGPWEEDPNAASWFGGANVVQQRAGCSTSFRSTWRRCCSAAACSCSIGSGQIRRSSSA